MKKYIFLFLFPLAIICQTQNEDTIIEEKSIQILLEKDVSLRGEVEGLWNIIREEENSEKIFFNAVNRKIKQLLMYSYKYRLQYLELSSKYSSLAESHDRYKNEASSWQNKCNQYASDAERYKNEASSWQNKCNQYASDADRYKNEASSWQNKCNQYASDTDKWQNNYKNSENLYRNALSEVDRYKKLHGDVSLQCIQAKKDNEELISTVNKLRSERDLLKSQLAGISSEYDAAKQYKGERDTLWQKNQQLSQENSDLNKKLAELAALLENYKNQPKPEVKEGNWYIARGTGSTTNGALADAWQNAMMQFLKENYAADDFEARRSEIKDFIGKNWRSYTVGSTESPIIVKAYDGRRLTIRVRVAEEDLLQDIMFQFDKARSKMDGMEVAFVAEPGRKSVDVANDILFDTLQDKMGQEVVIRDLRAIDHLMKTEAQILGLAAGADPASYVARKFNQVKILIYLDVETYVISDPYAGQVAYAKMKCRGVWQQTAQELWHFQINSGKEAKPVPTLYIGEKTARERAAKNAALAAYEKIREQVRERRNVLPTQTYELKFVNFYSKRDRDNIYNSIADLKHGKTPVLKIVPGSYGGGESYFTVKVEWLRGKHSIEDVIAYIEETCTSNQTTVNANTYSKGVIIFTPQNNY